MCGITGIVARDGIAGRLAEAVGRMNGRLVHRGPDGAGEFFDRQIGMAMRRLSVIDLDGGWQPLYNEDRSLVLVANGEIYNFVELRSMLEAKGHRFATRSDTETILHLYEEHGLDFVHHLRGMFALALWDAGRQRLVLARDRMGEKPLYLYESDGVLAFASELKAMLGSGLMPFELDPVAIDLYFHYSWVPEPRTPIKGIRKLDAGHLAVIDVDPWRVQETCYWRLQDAPPLQAEPVAAIRQELESVSRLVVRSDVPVGVALSSGLDSSAVAALAVRSHPGTVHAFSVGYPGRPPCDERAEARLFADELRIPFHDVELRTPDMVRDFAEMTYWRDDPIADISGYAYYSVMRLARENGVPVVLQGHGGDELFWGYPDVRDWLRKSARSPQLAKASGWSRWLRVAGGLGRARSEYKDALELPPGQTLFFKSHPDYQEARSEGGRYYSDRYRAALAGHDPGALFTLDAASPSLDVMFTAWICNSYLRENGVAQTDRLSMASGVELRLPLLDHKLVETVIGLRKTQSDAHLPPKAWFKSALHGLVPDSVAKRPKRGFQPPVGEWYRELFAHYGKDLEGGWLVSNDILSADGASRFSRAGAVSGTVHPMSFKALVLEEWARGMASAAS